jgi:hypothetical protein
VVSSSKPHAHDDLPARERVKKLEHALAKSEAAHKALQHDLDTLQAKSVAKSTLEKASKDLTDAQLRIDADHKRIQILEGELRKSRENLNTVNSTAAEANKGQRERTFVLENELSKTREALAILEARPDNSLTLQAEIDRLRENLTNSTRVIGELRKQEAAATQALTKCQAQLEAATHHAAVPEAGPVSVLAAMEMATHKPNKTKTSSKIADAMAEVEQLQARNAQKEAERLAAESAAAAKAEQERLAAEQAAAAKAEQECLAAGQAAADQATAGQAAAEQAPAEAAAEQAAAAKAEQERLLEPLSSVG